MANRSKDTKEWSQKVLEDFKDSTESLPSIDEPSGFDKRVSYARALVNAGATIADAARATGLEYMVLTYQLKGKNAVVPVEVKEEQEAIIRDQAVEGLLRSGERIVKMIDDGEMSPNEMIKANQVLRDTVSTLDHWKERGTTSGQKTSDALGSLVDAVISGKLVKSDEKPGDDAIDVTPERDDD